MIFSNKMEIKCPKCGVTIDYLLNRVTRIEECETRYDEEMDELDWGDWYDPEIDDTVISSVYLCPFCKEEVADYYNDDVDDDVLRIFRGK